MSQTRRSFLQNSSFAAVGACSALRNMEALGQSGFNSKVYENCNAAHAIASGHSLYGGPTCNIWEACAFPMGAAAQDWQQNNYDEQLKQAAYLFNLSWLKSSNIDQARLLAGMQSFTPQVSQADIQRSLSYLDSLSASQVQNALVTVQQTGIRQTILALAEESISLGQFFSGNSSAQRQNPAGLSPLFTLPPQPPPPGGDDGGNGPGQTNPKPIQGDPPGAGGKPAPWSCAQDGVGVLAAGTIFAVVAILAAPVSGPILAGAAWEGIGFWGGTITTTWAIAHSVAGCSF